MALLLTKFHFSSCNSPHFFTSQQQINNNNQQQMSQQQTTIIRHDPQASLKQQAPRASSLESQQQHGSNGSIG
jgi:hypothetical protein